MSFESLMTKCQTLKSSMEAEKEEPDSVRNQRPRAGKPVLVGSVAQQFAHALDPLWVERRDLFRPNYDLGADFRQTGDSGRGRRSN
jgi:hypothetical protein